MKCSHCSKEFEEKVIHEHHTHPRFMDNKKGVGKKIYLCEKCHNILHLKIPSIYWNLLSEEQKNKAIKLVVAYSMKWGEKDDADT
jgi:DNA-directed RNA polymerase subunit RPC12/RpoP